MPDGRVLHGTVLSTVLKVFPEVARWQARQTAPDELRILVVPTRHWSDASAGAIIGKLSEKLGSGVRYQVEPVDNIPLSPAGKFQTIVPFDPSASEPISPASESG
jgi:hypothetical protein